LQNKNPAVCNKKSLPAAWILLLDRITPLLTLINIMYDFIFLKENIYKPLIGLALVEQASLQIIEVNSFVHGS
jgi:hypothetical protein